MSKFCLIVDLYQKIGKNMKKGRSKVSRVATVAQHIRTRKCCFCVKIGEEEEKTGHLKDDRCGGITENSHRVKPVSLKYHKKAALIRAERVGMFRLAALAFCFVWLTNIWTKYPAKLRYGEKTFSTYSFPRITFTKVELPEAVETHCSIHPSLM